MSTIDNPVHYAPIAGVRPIDIAEHLPHCFASAFEYAWRAGKKGSAAEDLRKAAWHMRREVKRMAGRAATFVVPVSVQAMVRRVFVAGVDGCALRMMLLALTDGSFASDDCKAIADECEREAAEYEKASAPSGGQ